MLLKKLSITNFRCHADLKEIPIHRLTVFIGENDAGKTGILSALEILLTIKTSLASTDYRIVDETQSAESIIIEGRFEIESHDTIPEDYRSLDGKTFILKKTFSRNGTSKCEVLGRGFQDDRFNTFDRQAAQIQRELLLSLEIPPDTNGGARITQFREAVAANRIPRQEGLLGVNFSSILDHLPRYQCVSSVEYKKPDDAIYRTLQTVIEATLKPKNPETNEIELLPELNEVKTKLLSALGSKIAEIEVTLKQANPKLESVQVEPSIDFVKSVTSTPLMLNTGDGPQSVNSFGEGTKRKLWMGLLEWDRRIQAEANISVIRIYDEPDVNLDYAAERKLFASILDATRRPNSRTQSIVSTHAITLIDRAPAESINLLKVDKDGNRSIDFFQSQGDDDVTTFLSTVGRSVGVSNSALFYEKAFLVVEGESEEIALPILYRDLFQRSLIEDGISLINLRSCGAWKAVLSVLSHNRAGNTVMFLDQDCTNPASSGYITPLTLAEIGYPSKFLSENCFYIGSKEFEDAFATTDIVQVPNVNLPKEDGSAWIDSDIDQFRTSGHKFGEDLIYHIRHNCLKVKRSSVRKTDFAEMLANYCCDSNESIPQKIIEVFRKVRILAGCEEPEELVSQTSV